jgi:hypothetical protein
MGAMIARFAWIASLLGALPTLLLSGLPSLAQRSQAAGPRRGELRALAEEFFAWRAATQPTTTDDVNRVERPEGWVPDFSPEALRRSQRRLEEFRGRLGAMRLDGWPVVERVDYLLLRSALDRVDWELNILRSARRNPNFYVDQTLGAFLESLLPPPPFSEARARNIVARLDSIPATLQYAKINLTEAAAPFADIALAHLHHVGEKLERVRKGLEPLMPEGQRTRLDAGITTAAAALAEYAAWLREKKPSMSAKVPVGRDAYEHFLKRVAMLPYSSDEILAMSALEWNRSVSFEAYARQRARNLPPARLFRDSAEQIAASQAAEEKIRRFLVEQGILDVPAGMGHYRTRSRPEYLAALDFAGELDDFTSPSRLGQDAVRYIQEPSPSLSFWVRALAEDPRTLIVHEGVPGHFFQLALSWAHPDPIRRHYFDSGPIEGIGFYAEELMLQFGLFDDAPHTPEILYRFMRLRALRVTADIKLARGEFSIDDAARYLAATVPMDETTARQEAAFFASTPGQAIAYQVGKLQIMRFLTDARLAQGEKFKLKEFHNSLWENGNVPIALQRWEYLGRDDEARKLW